MKQLLIEYKIKEPVLLLAGKTLRTLDGNLNLLPNYQPNYKPVFRKGKYWKPCNTELAIMKKKLDKLVPVYEEAQGFGLMVKAKRVFKKALQISKRISVLLGEGGQLDNPSKEKAKDTEVTN